MADEEFRVEVDLHNSEHGFTFWDRLRALGLDDDARKRLGRDVTVTRDGTRMLLYTHTLADAREAERTVRELVTDDHLSADYTITQWSPEAQHWTKPGAPDEVSADDAEDTPESDTIPNPGYVMLQAYKPEFLRDLGL